MKNSIRSMIGCAVFVAMSQANAAAQVQAGAIDNGIWVSGVSGTASFNIERMGVAFINTLGGEVAAVSPTSSPLVAQRYAPNRYGTIQANMPLAGIGFSGDGHATATIDSLSALGGFRLDVVQDDLTNTGGALVITNLSVDTKASAIYADIWGGNGLGALSRVHFFNYSQGPADLALQAGGTNVKSLTFSGLTFAEAGQGHLEQGLGLLPDAISILGLINRDSFATLTVSLTANVAAVPEPSHYALLGSGLAVLALYRRRRAAA